MAPGERIHPVGMLKCCRLTANNWTEKGISGDTRFCNFCGAGFIKTGSLWRRI